MYQPTEYQMSIFKLSDKGDYFEVGIRRDFPISTAKKATQYVIAKFAFIVEQMEAGKKVVDYAPGGTCAACAYTGNIHLSPSCSGCPVRTSCESVTFDRFLESAGGRNLYDARRVLAMVQREYERNSESEA